MRRRAAIAIVVTAAAGLAAAEPPAAKVDLSRADRWQAGDVVTTTLQDVETFKTALAVPAGGSAQEQTFDRRTVAIRVEKCVEADAQGSRTKVVVWFREWSIETTGKVAGAAATSEKDTSLHGAYVEVSGRGRERRFTVVASPSALTERAREWLGKRYGPGSGTEEDLRLARRPKAPVAIGEKWAADVGPILDVGFPGEAVDRSKASVTYTLTSVSPKTKSALVTYDLTFPLTSLPTKRGQPSAPWKKGGTYVVRGNETVGLEGRVTSGGSASQGLLQGEVTWQGRPMTVVLQFRRQEAYRVGGEFPEPKAGGGAPK